MSTNWQPMRRVVLWFSRVRSSELRISSEVAIGPISGSSMRQLAITRPTVVSSSSLLSRRAMPPTLMSCSAKTLMPPVPPSIGTGISARTGLVTGVAMR